MGQKVYGVVFGGGNVATWLRALEGGLEALPSDHKLMVFSDGFTGLNEGRFYIIDDKTQFDPELPGTFSGTSRDNVDESKIRAVRDKLIVGGFELEGIIGCCGNDHLKVLADTGSILDLPVIGWPKTMDNDLSGTLCTLGFPTAAHEAAQATQRAALAAYNFNRVHILTYFGRDTDWVVSAAALWGFSDVVIGTEIKAEDKHTMRRRVDVFDNDTEKRTVSETVGYKFDYILERTREAIKRNRSLYGKGFAVVSAAEAGKIYGIENHVDKEDLDKHGHPKFNPETLMLALRKAYKSNGIDAAGEAVTYDHCRFRPATRLDAEVSRLAGIEAVRALITGKNVVCVVITNITDGTPTFDLKPLPEVYRQRFLRPEGFMDYNNLAVNPALEQHFECLFGPVGQRYDRMYKKIAERQV